MRLFFILFALVFFSWGQNVAAEPVSEKSTINKRGKRKQRAKKKRAKRKKGKARGRSGRPASSDKPAGQCNLKNLHQARKVEVDPAIEKLFSARIIMDGTLYPYFRGGLKRCCKHEKTDETCIPKAQAQKEHKCYDSRTPTDFTEIVQKTGIQIGGGPYTDSQAGTIDGYRKEGKKIRVIRTSNDIDSVANANEYGSILYIQTWDKAHRKRKPKDLARRIYKYAGRVVQPAYDKEKNSELKYIFAGGADEDTKKLTSKGIELIGHLLDQFILVDVSHVGTQSALDIIKLATRKSRPVIANHANATGVYDDSPDSADCPDGCPSRNHSDKVICGIARTGGVIGITPIRFMFAPKTRSGYKSATENDFLTHLDYVAKGLKCYRSVLTTKGIKRRRIDMTHHVSLASDGRVNGYNKDVKWLYMKVGAQLDRWKRIATRLKNECNYSMTEISRIVGDNLQRVYRAGIPGMMRPITKSPKNNSTVTSKTVSFKWRPPKINNAKWRPFGQAKIKKAKNYTLYIKRKKGRTYVSHKTLKVGKKTGKSTSLPAGRYRWYVRASNGKQAVNSEWQYFIRK